MIEEYSWDGCYADLPPQTSYNPHQHFLSWKYFHFITKYLFSKLHSQFPSSKNWRGNITCTYCHSFHVLSACLLTITMYCHYFRGPDLFCPINVPESIAMSSYSVQVHELSLFPLELCMHCYLLHVTLPMFMYCQSVI